MPPQPSRPVHANFPSEHLTVAAGIAIFHLASQRVVLCYHTRDKYYFLPKGRKNANEDLGRAAEREGYEESGYKNRLLPIPMRHRAPDADGGHEDFVKEAVWVQILPLSERTQYVLFWFVGETVPVGREGVRGGGCEAPEAFGESMTLEERMKLDLDEEGKVREPVRHEGTGVDEEEALYTAALVPIEEACKRLKGTVMEDVVRRGWDGIQKRMQMEENKDNGA